MASNYVVLARKWRPKQFSDIVGQGPVVRTLMNAIRAERIHQAYLMTGSRGIGKTSIARIFAKAVRCEHTKWEDSWLSSCDHCASCREITQGNSVDVIEIDGASNNGVDAVREIRENAKYLPASGGRKIYIIDEVHMLTTAAFNALLKTLEEPPAHVIFIFATTEPHKIPATILSRVQRFDLRRVTIAQIQTRLSEVLQAEKIQAEAGALALVARAAEGSMRDALSLLDQVIAFSGNQISTQSVRDCIGLIEGQTLLGILKGVLSRKPLEALALVDQAYQQGHDLRILTRSLIELLHAALLASLGAPSPANLEVSGEEWTEIQALSKLRPLEEMELIFQVLHQGVDWIARSPQPKVVLDVLLVKCATAEALVYVENAGSGSSGGSASPSLTVEAKKPLVSEVTRGKSSASAAATIASAIEAGTPAVEAVAEVPTPPVSAPASVAASKPKGPVSWEGLIAHVRQTRPLLASILEHAHCSEMTDLLEISFRPEESYYREQLQSRVYSEQLVTLGKEYFGHHIRVKVEIKESGESLAEKRAREHQARETAAINAVNTHPIIAEAKALFGGELGPIELVDPSKGMNSHAAF